MARHRRCRPRRAGLVALVAVAVLASACGSSRPAPSAPTPAPTAAGSRSVTPHGSPAGPAIDASASASPIDAVSATATASTLFDTARAFRLELRRDGPPLSVTSLVLASPWYEPVEATPRAFTLSSGRLLLVPLPHGAAACRSGSPEPGVDVGVVVLQTDTGPLRVALRPHPDDLVGQRHRRECAVAAIEAVADLSFGDDWVDAGTRTVTGTIEVAADPGHAIEVQGVGGNIIFAMESEQALPMVVEGRSGRLAVRVSAARCDTHALIEAKRKLHFPLTVSLDGADPVVVEVEATDDAAAVFRAQWEACLDTPPS